MKPHHTSTRGTTNAMKSGFIPAIRCAKKKPGMCCFCIWNAECEGGGIDFFIEEWRKIYSFANQITNDGK